MARSRSMLIQTRVNASTETLKPRDNRREKHNSSGRKHACDLPCSTGKSWHMKEPKMKLHFRRAMMVKGMRHVRRRSAKAKLMR